MSYDKQKSPAILFVAYIFTSVLIFFVLTVIHSWLSFHQIQPLHFLVPLFAAIVVGYLLARNHLLHKQLTQLAYTDKLTGIYNRQYFDKLMQQETDRAKRYGHYFSIIYLDLDHFKRVNDNFGHGVGDKILIEFSRIVAEQTRESDIFARFGGEEFIILSQMSDSGQAMTLYERIRTAVKAHKFKKVKALSFSAGITMFNVHNDSINSILERADNALYNAKESGRDQAVVAERQE